MTQSALGHHYRRRQARRRMPPAVAGRGLTLATCQSSSPSFNKKLSKAEKPAR